MIQTILHTRKPAFDNTNTPHDDTLPFISFIMITTTTSYTTYTEPFPNVDPIGTVDNKEYNKLNTIDAKNDH